MVAWHRAPVQGEWARERERELWVRDRRKNGRRKRRREAGCGDGLVQVVGGGAPVADRRQGEEEAGLEGAPPLDPDRAPPRLRRKEVQGGFLQKNCHISS